MENEDNIFKRIRESTRWVNENAKHVHICHSKVKSLAEMFVKEFLSSTYKEEVSATGIETACITTIANSNCIAATATNTTNSATNASKVSGNRFQEFLRPYLWKNQPFHCRIEEIQQAVGQSKLNISNSNSQQNSDSFSFSSPEEILAQYVLVVDCLNFCFWPAGDVLEYEHLAGGLKKALLADITVFDAKKLCDVDEKVLYGWIGNFPLMKERVEALKEVGHVLCEKFEGKALNIIKVANHSSERVVHIMTSLFSKFHDHSFYQGKEVFFLKRAQIFVGDIWGAFCGNGFGYFHDILDLTTFPDYRLPQFLWAVGVLTYSNNLEKRIRKLDNIEAQSPEEIEIRSATVVAVDLLHSLLLDRKEFDELSTVELDWWIWSQAVAQLTTLPPHHRTMTIFY